MSKINQTFVIMVLLCLAQSHDVNAAIKSYKKYHNHPEKQVFYSYDSFKEGNLVYAVCDGTVKEKNCTLMQERYPDGKLLRSCNVTLEDHHGNANITDKIYVVAFGRDHAILFWDEIQDTVGSETLFHLLTVKLDYCSYGGFALADPFMEIYNQMRYNNKIITYNDTFEIFIKSNDHNDTERVISVRSNGFSDLNDQAEFLKSGKYSIRYITPIDINSSKNKSYVYFKEWLEEYLLVILKPDGSEKVLASRDNKFFFFSSLVNDLISLCERKDIHSTMTCTQYDKEGNVKFNLTFDNEHFKERIVPRHMYNLPDVGGFLIVLSEYAKSGDEVDYSTVTDYIIIKVNSEGKKAGSIHLKELVDADNLIKVIVDVRIWKNENEEYCAGVIGQGVNQTNSYDKLSDLSIVVNCFTGADLAV